MNQTHGPKWERSCTFYALWRTLHRWLAKTRFWHGIVDCSIACVEFLFELPCRWTHFLCVLSAVTALLFSQITAWHCAVLCSLTEKQMKLRNGCWEGCNHLSSIQIQSRVLMGHILCPEMSGLPCNSLSGLCTKLTKLFCFFTFLVRLLISLYLKVCFFAAFKLQLCSKALCIQQAFFFLFISRGIGKSCSKRLCTSRDNTHCHSSFQRHRGSFHVLAYATVTQWVLCSVGLFIAQCSCTW